MSDLALDQLIDRLHACRDHGPNDLHELTYQLALQLRAAREEIAALRRPRPESAIEQRRRLGLADLSEEERAALLGDNLR